MRPVFVLCFCARMRCRNAGAARSGDVHVRLDASYELPKNSRCNKIAHYELLCPVGIQPEQQHLPLQEARLMCVQCRAYSHLANAFHGTKLCRDNGSICALVTHIITATGRHISAPSRPPSSVLTRC